jgi:hypothetical protein
LTLLHFVIRLSLVTIELRRRGDGQTEMLVAGQYFLIAGEPPHAVIAKELLQNVRLSELPGEIPVKPAGVSIVLLGGTGAGTMLFTDSALQAMVRLSC